MGGVGDLKMRFSCSCPKCQSNDMYLSTVNFNDLEGVEEVAVSVVEGEKFTCDDCSSEYQFGLFDVTDKDLSPLDWDKESDW